MTIHDAAGANVFRRVDHNVDAGTVLFGEFGDRFTIRHVERHDFDALDFAQIAHPGERLPGIRKSDKNDRRSGIGKRFGHSLPDAGAAIRDQDTAELRIARHLAQMRIISHVLGVLFRQRDRHRRAAFVELELEPHAPALHRIAVKMRNDDRADIEFHGPHPPRRALAKIGIGRRPHRRFGDERAAASHVAEWKTRRQA
jgi:hypothetical protein